MNANLWSSTTIIATASFVTNLILFTFYFSHITATKGYLHRNGFVISLLGTGFGAAFYLLLPLLPDSIPWMDVSTGLIVVVWLLLSKQYTQMSWLGSFAVAAFGALLHMLVTWLVQVFVLGVLIIFGFAPVPFP